MLFPVTKFASRNTILEQLDHLQSEINEVREAVESGDLKSASLELVDVQQSADTALHILLRMGIDSYSAYTEVTIKNARRGYYADAHPNMQRRRGCKAVNMEDLK